MTRDDPQSDPAPTADAHAPNAERSTPANAEPTPAATPEAAANNEARGGDHNAPATKKGRWRSLLLAAALLGVTFLLMANSRAPSWGVQAGLCTTVLGVVLLTLRFGHRAQCEPAAADASLGGATLQVGGAALAHLLSVGLATWGGLPLHRVSAAIVVTGTFLWLLVAVFRWMRRAKLTGPEAIWQHGGFWLLAIASCVQLPMLGNFGLIDPWETHYGEVAREILARDDWISLWWAQDGWFYTKPILNFWLQALSFKLFGVQYLPGEMLLGDLSGRTPSPEWAARIPIFWLTAGASYTLYKGSARLVGTAAAVAGGCILLSSPYWFFLTRQTMADMPYVAPVTAAMGFLLLGFSTPSEKPIGAIRVSLGQRTLTLNAYQVLLGSVLLCSIPQILYLLAQNITLQLDALFDDSLASDRAIGFHVHFDDFSRGSGGGNCGQAGNRSCATQRPLWPEIQPAYAALVWTGVLLAWLWLNRREYRQQRIYFVAAWLCTTLAFMAKGAPALVLPLATALAFVVLRGRFRDLLRLELASLGLLLGCVALPWFVQMFARHGLPFVERLFIHDMVKRAFAHVHDTNEGDDVSFRYYIWQLGYGLFPWGGLALAGGLAWLEDHKRKNEGKQMFGLFMLVWVLVGFGMFSITRTKFHHYILPIVPPLAALSGPVLVRFFPETWPAQRVAYLKLAGSILLATLLLLFGLTTALGGSLLGSPPREVSVSSATLAFLAALAGIALGVFSFRRWPPDASPRSHFRLGLISLAGAVGAMLAGIDMATTLKGDLSGNVRLLHLFTYEYSRPWPESLDFSSAFTAFTILATVSLLLLGWRRFRPHGATLLAATAGLWTLWCVDIYFVIVEPHWGQRDTILAYYRNRNAPDEPLVAYQMNWKGENFYTGNKMATFVTTRKKFKKWVTKQRKKGVTTMFFTTEHSRIRTLKRELDHPKHFTQLTSKNENNKFFMARVDFDDAVDEEPKDEAKKASAANARDKRPSPNSEMAAPSNMPRLRRDLSAPPASRLRVAPKSAPDDDDAAAR